MKMNKNINPKEVLDKLSEDIGAMRDWVESGNHTKEEISEFRKDLQEVILQGYKTKFTVRLDILKDEEPNLTKKDILVKMLDLLPSDVNPEFLPVLTEYVLENWNVLPHKKVA